MSLKVPPLRMRKDWHEGLDQSESEAYISLHELIDKTEANKTAPAASSKGEPKRYKSVKSVRF